MELNPNENKLNDTLNDISKQRINLVASVAVFMWPIWIFFDFLFFPSHAVILSVFRILLSLSCLAIVLLLKRNKMSKEAALSILLIPAYLFVGYLVNIAPEENIFKAFVGGAMIPVASFLILILSRKGVVFYTIIAVLSVFVFQVILQYNSISILIGDGGILYFSLTAFAAATNIIFSKTIKNDLKNKLLIEHSYEQLHLQQIALEDKNRKLESALQEREVLLKEVHHRVKNNLQIVSSLLRLQSKTKEGRVAASVLKESINRITTMSIIHENLYKNNSLDTIDLQTYINNLVLFLKDSLLIGKNIAIHSEIDNIGVGLDKMVPCGLIINELLTNAAKYAFKKGQKGKIAISFSAENNIYVLTVKDNGKGLPNDINPATSNSLGLNLIIGLAAQINGKAEFINNNGLTVNVRFEKLCDDKDA